MSIANCLMLLALADPRSWLIASKVSREFPVKPVCANCTWVYLGGSFVGSNSPQNLLLYKYLKPLLPKMLKPPFIFSVYVLVCYVYFYACIFMNFTRAYFKDITDAA